MYQKDTIAAIATPVGSGAVGIVKISGPSAIEIATGIFRSAGLDTRPPESRHLYYGVVFDPADGSQLDDALVAFMRSPATYTGEDVVEINCHSGSVVLQQVLNIVLRGGARLAEPGEFTRRAFMNGRIDLPQAEAVIDIIEARSESGLKVASRQLQGALSTTLGQARQTLIDITAAIEASIDFPEDTMDDPSRTDVQRRAAALLDTLGGLAATYESGALFRSGVQVVIAGKANVGKSSLLNALLGSRRAIVTNLPGTTRDIIQETITIKGIPVRIVDTAGLHDCPRGIEKIGIDLAIQKMSDADIVLFVLDGSAPLDAQDQAVADRLLPKKVISVINKVDLAQAVSAGQVEALTAAQHTVSVSALHGTGIETLKERIAGVVLADAPSITSDILIANTRHKVALEKICASLRAVHDGLSGGLSPELIAVDLMEARTALGELTGETTTEDILDSIFSTFCIGK